MYVCIDMASPPTRAYLEPFLVEFAVKKQLFFCPAFCVIYILPIL